MPAFQHTSLRSTVKENLTKYPALLYFPIKRLMRQYHYDHERFFLHRILDEIKID